MAKKSFENSTTSDGGNTGRLESCNSCGLMHGMNSSHPGLTRRTIKPQRQDSPGSVKMRSGKVFPKQTRRLHCNEPEWCRYQNEVMQATHVCPTVYLNRRKEIQNTAASSACACEHMCT